MRECVIIEPYWAPWDLTGSLATWQYVLVDDYDDHDGKDDFHEEVGGKFS